MESIIFEILSIKRCVVDTNIALANVMIRINSKIMDSFCFEIVDFLLLHNFAIENVLISIANVLIRIKKSLTPFFRDCRFPYYCSACGYANFTIENVLISMYKMTLIKNVC